MSTIDLSLIRDTVNGIINKVTVAIRFLAVFCLLIGIPVLVSAVAATRRERVREGVLLKTLGATRAQVGRIMVAEYAILGVLASIAGIALSFAAAWGLVHFVFDTPFTPAVVPVLAIAALTASLTIAIGVAGSRDVFAETPLRDAASGIAANRGQQVVPWNYPCTKQPVGRRMCRPPGLTAAARVYRPSISSISV